MQPTRKKPKKRIVSRTLVGLAFIVIGLLIALTLVYPLAYNLLAAEPVMNPQIVKDGRFWLVIPEISVDTIVRNEVSRHTLRRAVAHLPGSGFPGDGTSIIIVGHQYNPTTAFSPQSSFGMLDMLKAGDTIFLAYEGVVYTYSVESKETLDADDSALYSLNDYECLTLLTCAPHFHETKRLKLTALPLE